MRSRHPNRQRSRIFDGISWEMADLVGNRPRRLPCRADSFLLRIEEVPDSARLSGCWYNKSERLTTEG